MIKEKICGIYCIKNIINNKRYVGQSININSRWEHHISALNNNNHYNSHLQKSWNKYGSESFEFNIVEICDKSLLNEREIYWIEKFNSLEDGYNETSGGDNFPKDTSKEVYMYALDGVFICKFDSISEALMHVNGNSITNIVKCCNGDLKTAYGHIWKFEYYDNVMPKNIAKNNENRKKEIHQYNLDGIYIKSYKNAMEAKSLNNIPIKSTYITSCCNGKRKTAYGYIWSYNKTDMIKINTKESTVEDKPVYMFNEGGTLIKTFVNLQSATDFISINYKDCNIHSKILNCCKKNRTKFLSQYNGYIWSYNKQLKIKEDMCFNGKYEKNKKVYQYDLSGKYMCEHKNSIEACKSINESSPANIRNCCLHKAKHAYGYIWSYEKKVKLDSVYKNISRKNIPVYQYDLNGKLLKKFDNLKDAMDMYNNHNLSECCKGRRNSAAGFIWAYEIYDNLEDLKNRYKIYQEN